MEELTSEKKNSKRFVIHILRKKTGKIMESLFVGWIAKAATTATSQRTITNVTANKLMKLVTNPDNVANSTNEFEYDPEEGVTLEAYCRRFEQIFEKRMLRLDCLAIIEKINHSD